MKLLPDGWCPVKIRELTTCTKQRDPRKNPNKPFRYVDVSSVSNTLFKIETAAEMLGAQAPSRARKEIKAHDVLFATVRPTLKRIALVPQELDGEIASTGYCVLRPQPDKVIPEFLYHSLLTNSFVKAMGALQRGASYPAVRDTDVFSATITLPPLPEQRRIAHVLSTVQTAIEQQARLIALTRELKSALMRKLFTEGLRGEKQKETEIGLVPESWKIEKVKDNAQVKGGKRVPKGDKLVDEKTDFPYLRVTNFEDHSIDTAGLKYLLPETHEQIKRYTITDKDVFISIAGTIGVTGMVPPELKGANLTENAAKIVLQTKKLSPRFLMYFLVTDGAQREIHSQTVKNAQPKLALVRIEALKIPIPELNEQEEIVQTIDTVKQKIILLQQKRNLLEELFRTLLHQLMTGQVRVNDLGIDSLSRKGEGRGEGIPLIPAFSPFGRRRP